MKKFTVILSLVLIIFVLFAQDGLKKNSIIGQVTGLDGLKLPKVFVEAHYNNQLVATTTTDFQGRYRFDNMNQGTYMLTYSLNGYIRLEKRNIQLLEGAPEVVDVVMQPVYGVPSTENRQSNTSVPLVAERDNTTNSGVSSVSDIVALQPGVTNVGGQLHIRGGRTNEVIYTIDGMSPGVYQQPSPVPNQHNTEEYTAITPNIYHSPLTEPLSTFSIDVDTATYSIVRRMLESNQLPPANAIRIEELVNYFDYEYPQPTGEHPFAIYTELSACPWNPSHQLVHIGLQGQKMKTSTLPPSNLVFLIDKSGSMMPQNKLPLVQRSLSMLVDNLRDIDRISIVTYASGTSVALPSTPGSQKSRIKDVINNLTAGGSTAGASGINLAYEQAELNLLQEGNNRVILCTDGDFNVGVSSTADLEALITSKRDRGIYLTVLGFGMGNYKDSRMETLADKGNGNYAYIDNITEAKKVLVNDLTGTLFTIAKDVKIQTEFNPAHVRGYRLIGYENRLLRAEDFRNDAIDAGELGAGHTVTAIYEIIPSSSNEPVAELDSLRYQMNRIPEEARRSPEMLTVKLRYKFPDSDTSIPLESPVLNRPIPLERSSNRFRFASAVVGYGMLLQNSAFKGNCNWMMVNELARNSIGEDHYGYEREFLSLVEKAANLSDRD